MMALSMAAAKGWLFSETELAARIVIALLHIVTPPWSKDVANIVGVMVL